MFRSIKRKRAGGSQADRMKKTRRPTELSMLLQLAVTSIVVETVCILAVQIFS